MYMPTSFKHKFYILLLIFLVTLLLVVALFCRLHYLSRGLAKFYSSGLYFSCELSDTNNSCNVEAPGYDMPPGASWYITPLDKEFSSSVYMNFIKRDQFYYVHVHETTFVSGDVYSREQIKFADIIHHELVNNSNYYYQYLPTRRVARLLDGEWFLYQGILGFTTLVLHTVNPSSTNEIAFDIRAIFPEDYVFDGGIYKIIKRLWREGYSPDENITWAYMIVQLS